MMMRNLAMIVYKGFGGTDSIQNVWPLHSDRPQDPPKQFTKDEIAEINKKANETFKRLKKSKK